MRKPISILDKDYVRWVQELKRRYRRSQIKAATKVNQENLKFNWDTGRDIVEMHVEERWGESVIRKLSIDLKRELPDAHCFSQTNLYYMRNFYLFYSQVFEKFFRNEGGPQNDIKPEIFPQLGGNFQNILFSIPWGHHKLIIDKFRKKQEYAKALFFVCQTIENGWSKDMLMTFMTSDLFERHGKALTNFQRTLPDETSGLAQDLTKDPYDFAFTGITGKYNESLLKDKLIENITHFLMELGTGFSYVGKEYRLQIGEKEKFIDLLFYNLTLSCYVVVEVKIGEFDFADVGQLGGYVVACNHILKKEGRDNPTIGLLICKQKDKLLAQYALESSSQPLGISEFDLEKLYPEKIDGAIPTIEEIEVILNERIEK